MKAYYNEHDPFAAAWLENLIFMGEIAPGDVDRRSIEDVTPNDLRGYTQHHFFAGIGIWSRALRDGGWPDDRPIWSMSCPCQPFSAAGKGVGFADERHLWPAAHWLVQQCAPDLVVGEQVEGPAGGAWFDLVQADLEAGGYACGQVVFPAAGVGAPHIRHRRYWLAHAVPAGRPEGWPRTGLRSPASSSSFGGLANDDDERRHGRQESRGAPGGREPSDHGWLGDDDDDARLQVGSIAADERRTIRDEGPAPGASSAVRSGALGDDKLVGLGHPDVTLAGAEWQQRSWELGRLGEDQRASPDSFGRPGPTNGFWRDVDWIWCRDGKFRPVEPGTFPLAHGYPNRVGTLRGYGNAICLPAATAFVEAVIQCL